MAEGRSPHELRKQMVVGHAEYRRVALRSEGFRRAFGEVFRSRALLFLGSGLADQYLLDLFSQVIELYGPTPHPHFAFALQDSLDVELLRRHFGISVYEVSSHDDLPNAIASLGARASRPRRRLAFSVASHELNVVTAPLPDLLTTSHCVVLSGGGSTGDVRLSRRSRDYLRTTGLVQREPAFDRVSAEGMVWRLSTEQRDTPLILVARARLDPASARGRQIRPIAPEVPTSAGSTFRETAGRLWRDARLTRYALREALEIAHAAGRTKVLTTILASGSLRTTPPSYQLIEMVRAWVEFGDVDMTIHTVDDVVVSDLRSGRIDIERILAPVDEQGISRPIEFWLEITEPDGMVVPILMQEAATSQVRDLLAEVGVVGDWTLSIEPVPCLAWKPWRLTDVGSDFTLERFGVLHGRRFGWPECRTDLSMLRIHASLDRVALRRVDEPPLCILCLDL